jgi:DNA-binding transcriptional regulator YhcF (GntR family)
MITMTLTVKSYTELEPFETLAKKRGVPVTIEDNIVTRNARRSSAEALKELQKSFAGEAERVGWKTEEDVVNYCKEIRREMWEEHHENNG